MNAVPIGALTVLWLALAHAGVVSEIPPGTAEVGLVLCDPDPCTRSAAYWLSAQPDAAYPILPLDNALATAGAWKASDEAREAFGEHLGRARTLLAEGDWVRIASALDRAELALFRTDATVPNQDLFDLWFLRGVARLRDGGEAYGTAFRQAASVAWNRDPALAVTDDDAAAAYYEALDGLLAERTGTIEVEALPAGESWFFDGIELGPGPYAFRALPGDHRLTAARAADGSTWSGRAHLSPGGTVRLAAKVPRPVEPEALKVQLMEVFLGGGASPELHAWLRGWCGYQGVSEVRLHVVTERTDRRGRIGYGDALLVYQPAQRSFRRGR